MIKNIAWNTFKKTGNIDTLMELMQVENIEKNMKVGIDEYNQNKGYNNSRKQLKWLWQDAHNFNATGFGKISCLAKGARRTKSLLLAGTQFLCFGEYILYKGGEVYRMNSCETIELFYNLRTDFNKLKYAALITKIINDVTTENQNTYKILRLFLNTLYTISEKEKKLDLVLAIFELRLVSMLGFKPIIDECVSCKTKENLNYFSISENGFKCDACSKQDTSSVKMLDTTNDAIKYSILAPQEKLFSFNIPEEAIRELGIIAKLYTNQKLEKEYKL